MRQLGDHPLWIGNARDARDLQGVFATGVEAIVDLAAEEWPASPTRDLVYLRFPIVDGGGNDPKVLRSLMGSLTSLIRDRVPTLVACRLGMSRSPTVAAVAYGLVHGIPALDVMSMIEGPRDVSPSLLRELKAVMSTG
jgi:protein-tyrosine phosphatase